MKIKLNLIGRLIDNFFAFTGLEKPLIRCIDWIQKRILWNDPAWGEMSDEEYRKAKWVMAQHHFQLGPSTPPSPPHYRQSPGGPANEEDKGR